jgi:hypothetical protein
MDINPSVSTFAASFAFLQDRRTSGYSRPPDNADRPAHFLSRAFNAVQGTFGMTGALPSTALRFAVCINEFTPTTSKMPSR